MKLNGHRADVKFLLEVAYLSDPEDAVAIHEAAKRFLNLIRMAEEADRLYYRGIYTDRARRVAKDAGK